jgi:hypothetical protein
MDEWLLVAMDDLQVDGISQADALNMVLKSVNSLYDLPSDQKWNGFYYTYDLSGDVPQKSGNVISQADNGNLAAALAAVIGAFNGSADTTKQEIVQKAQAILDGMDWTKFVDTTVNKMYTALDINADGTATPQGFSNGTPYYVDNIFNEMRLGVVFGMIQDGVDQAVWDNMVKYITTYTIDDGVSVTTLKSGSGEMFQALLPSIFFNESEWSEDNGALSGFGVALKNFVLAQDYFAKSNGLSGLLSSSMNPYVENGYSAFGVGALGVYPVAENVSAPYASALAYLVDPALAMEWLQVLYGSGVDTSFGFKDAIAASGSTSNRLLILDDAMIVLSLEGDTIANYVESYLNSIGKLDTVKELYQNVLTLEDQVVTSQDSLTPAQEAIRDSIETEHFLAFADNIVDSETGWTYDHFDIQSGWAAAGFSYTNGADLTALGQNIIVGVKGDSSRIKFEVTDGNNNKAFVYLDGVSATQENVYAISLSSLQGVDLSNIKTVYFIVEGDNKVGTLEVSRVASSMLVLPSSTLTSHDINVPGNGTTYPEIQSVAPSADNITVIDTDRGIEIQYDTKDDGWAGGGFAYNVQGYSSTDLSGLSSLVFGIKGSSAGTPQKIKLEIKDSQNNSSVIYLGGIDAGTEKMWSIPLSTLSGNADLSDVRYIYFIVEGNDQQGTFYVNIVKEISPTDSVAVLPNVPADDSSTVGLSDATVTPKAGGFTLAYSTGTVGWAGASIIYNSAKSFSAYDVLVFRMVGSSSKIKFEMKDNLGYTYSLYLIGVKSDLEQTWIIDLSLIEGLSMSQIKEINFIVEGANQSGTLDVTTNQ